MEDAVTILGLGYVGFPTAMHFAESGVKVYGFDVNEKLIEKLKEGQIPYVEMKKEYELKRYLKEGLFVPTEDLKVAMEDS
ncbi:MAG: nucleotide sugar dehydrogenase, partial [Thermoplasmata archaeon]|nr:nucleotide sugar dehydrogenase [Thermoplasmata archaeon]